MTSSIPYQARRRPPASVATPRCAPRSFPGRGRAAGEGRRRCRTGLLAAVLPVALAFAPAAWGQASDSVTYRMTFTGLWTADDITDSSLPGGAHFTQVVGATHNAETTLWRSGGQATPGVERVAELGETGTLLSEIGRNSNTDGVIRAGTSFIGPTATVSTPFTVDPSHPLVSVLSMVAPSPDWFVGVNSLRLYDSNAGEWRRQVSMDLYPYDAGTEHGNGWSLSNPATSPQGSITSIRNTGRFGNNPLARLTFELQTPPSPPPPPPPPQPPAAVAPTVTIDTEPAGDEGTSVRLSASLTDGTYDGAVEYAWSVSGGILSSASAKSPTWTRPSVSTNTDHTVRLTITVRGTGTNARDGTSDTANANREVRVRNVNPGADDDHVEDRVSAAWLARSGRTMAEQGLGGIAERMAAPRIPGLVGRVAGRHFGVTPWSGGASGAGAVGRSAATNAGSTSDAGSTSGTGGVSGFGSTSGAGPALRAMAEVAHGFDRTRGSIETEHFGSADVGPAGVNPAGFNAEHLDRSPTLAGRDLLLGSAFTLTGEMDAGGGSMAFWGRAAHGSFDGGEGTLSLDGEMTTGMLGVDYARGPWLFGLALAQSEGDSEYRDTASASSQDDRTRNGAASPTNGTVESTLTAALPYASWRASQRLSLWGAAGFGAGEMTLTPDAGASMRTDTDWTMAALGLRSALLAPPAPGLALALVSDGLWVRTASDRTEDLAASAADVTRLRFGLEGSWQMVPDAASGAHLTPSLGLGLRHDGGDAETGLGVELGGGLAWSVPRVGLALDITGRTLLAHADGDFEDRGLAASLTFDPDPTTERGLSLSLRQGMGSSAQGGLDALFADAPMAARTARDSGDPGDPGRRWTAQAAYGLPAFSGRFVAIPHIGLGLAAGEREYRLGGRLTPAARANALDLTFGVLAKRVESETSAPEHGIGLEFGARW